MKRAETDWKIWKYEENVEAHFCNEASYFFIYLFKGGIFWPFMSKCTTDASSAMLLLRQYSSIARTCVTLSEKVAEAHGARDRDRGSQL